MIVRKYTVKEIMQKKFLVKTVEEAYGVFSEEHPNVKIGRAKFADFRPKHVCCNSKFLNNMCLCKCVAVWENHAQVAGREAE